MNNLSSIRALAAKTPADRNRAVDALRAVSILVVVFGHWLMAAVTVQDGQLSPGHLLELTGWTHPLTWLLQVMPIFFFVGGFANAGSWRSARRRGEPYGIWLRNRLRRLVLPVVPLLAVWGAGGFAALELGLDWQMLSLASQVAIVPTWFLAAYVVVVTLAPLTLWVWERFGWLSVGAGALLAGAADVASLGFGLVPVGFLNYVFVWGTVHQLGYAWVDGRMGGTVARLQLAGAGLVATAALVAFGPYPMAMVGLDAAEVANSYPPRVTLVALGVFQAGLAVAGEGWLRRRLEGGRLWHAVVAVNAQIMTLYLWHLTAMVAAVGLSLAVGGWGLGVKPLGPVWWLSRPLWFAVLALATLGLVAGFGRFERPRPDPRPAPPGWRPVLAVVSIVAGLGLLAAIGIADAEGLNGLLLVLPLAGVVVGGVGGARLWQVLHPPAS